MNRREALRRVGALAATPLLGAFHPLVPAQQGGGPWAPRFFDEEEAQSVAALVELIIPETDTPGAREAQVHQYIDWIVSGKSAEARTSFRDGLKPYVHATTARRVELLERGGEFFDRLKALTVEGYYRSEIGMKEELGFEGRVFVTEFEGCTHDEHLSWSPSERKK